MIKRSTNGGLNWSNDIRITNNSASSRTPSIDAIKTLYENVRVTWEDTRDGNSEIFYAYSLDGGINFFPETRIVTLNSSNSILPTISCNSMDRHIAWQDDRDGNYEIYYTYSSGSNWINAVRLTNNSGISQFPCIIRDNNFLGVVWYDSRDGNNEIYLKTSTNAGSNWSSDKRLTNQSAGSTRPSMEISGQYIHVAWEDYRDGHSEIYYKSSPDQGLSWSVDTRLTNTSGNGADSPSIFISGSGVYLVWQYNNEIYFKRNPTGNPIGIKNISTEIPSAYSLEQNYPNPFNPSTKIRFSVPNSGFTTIKIFDILGKEISTLVNQSLQPGTYETTFDGSGFNSGVYFYNLSAGDFNETKRMLFIK